MKRINSLLLVLFLNIPGAFAQMKHVNFNVVTNQLNEGNPVPSEERFYITGRLPQDIEFVKVQVYRTGKNPNQGTEHFWKSAFDFEVKQYELLISSPLKSNESYDFDFYYYQRAEEQQMTEVKEAVISNLKSYIQSNFEVSNRGIKSYRSEPVMIKQMNQIVRDGLQDYRHFLGREFEGFSDIVLQKLEQKDKIRLRRARFNILGKNKEDNEKAVYAKQYLEELINLVSNETAQYLDRSLMSLVDIRKVSNYPTEKKPSTLPLNFGYGAFGIKRTLPSTEYFNGPYIGLSLPLANRTFQKILGNASISTGVFVQKFTAENGDRITGPLVNLPIYAGIGYKVLKVMRFNAGVVAINLEEADTNRNTNFIQPFVGISLEFNLWIGLNDRR